jgi:hypothetical protein
MFYDKKEFNKNMNDYYNISKLNNLKFKFKNCESIEKNHSQAYQDIFVLSMLDGKKNGCFIEIGTFHPTEISNTFLLEKQFGWSGLSIDINHIDGFESQRNSKLIVQNALEIDYEKLFEENNIPIDIDYLQIDIEPAHNTLACLKKIPFNKYNFSVITYETDYYNSPVEIRNESREIFRSNGYELIGGDICNAFINLPFEDWYVKKDKINKNIFDIFNNPLFNDTAEKFMLKSLI